MTNPVDDLGNPKIDFVWGNIPMQPDDQREDAVVPLGGGEGDAGWGPTAHFKSAPLDPNLDSHIIATGGYQNFPSFTTGGTYDDTIANTIVPNLIGLNLIQVGEALGAANLIGSQSLSTVGATLGNNGKVKSQALAAGTAVNVNTAVNYVSYNYVAANPIAGMRTNLVPAGWTLGAGDIVMYLVGRTVKPTVGDVIKVVGNTNTSLNQGYNVIAVVNDDVFNTGGTAVQLTAFEKAYDTPNINSGGTWQDFFA